MSQSKDKSRYRDGASDYAHRFHAGNVADVLKHCLLLTWVRALQAQSDGPLHIIDTHAGSGMYTLPPKGEWDAGIGRLDALGHDTAPSMVRAYLTAVGDRRVLNRGGLYPGSPALLKAALRPNDRLSVVEIAEAPQRKLAEFYADDTQVTVEGGDGLAYALAQAEAQAPETPLAIFIDPPYSQKAEWQTVTDAVRAIREAHSTAAICVWYPIKSLMRPRAFAAALRDLGAGATVDLISTPLSTGQKSRRKTLKGSGLLFLDPPAPLLARAGAELPWLGAALAHPSDKEWTASIRGWL